MKPPRVYTLGIRPIFGGIRRSTLLRSSSLGGSDRRIHPWAYAHALLLRRIDFFTGSSGPFFFTPVVVIVCNYRQVAEWVVRGRYPIVVGLSAQLLQEFWAQGLGKDVKVVRPKAAVWTVSAAALSLMEGTPHPNAAKV